MALKLGLARIPLPPFLASPTGTYCDVFPVLTMLCCVPVLRLHFEKARRSGKWADCVISSIAWLFALFFHIAYMHQDGISNASVLGVNGVMWRTLDIITANLLFARLFGAAIDDSHPLVSLHSVALPTSLCALLLTQDQLSMRSVTHITLLAILVTLCAKVAVDSRSPSAFPSYPRGVAARMCVCLLIGFFCFLWPERRAPQHYWFYHSMWHVLMSVFFYDLYAHREGVEVTWPAKIKRVASFESLARLNWQGLRPSLPDRLRINVAAWH